MQLNKTSENKSPRSERVCVCACAAATAQGSTVTIFKPVIIAGTKLSRIKM